MQGTMKTRSLLVAMLVMGAIGGFGGKYLGNRIFPQQKEVRAKSFVLVNDTGSMRGMWVALPNRSAVMTMFDAEGRARGQFVVFPDGRPNLTLFDSVGNMRGVFQLSLKGIPSLEMIEAICCEDKDPKKPMARKAPPT